MPVRHGEPTWLIDVYQTSEPDGCRVIRPDQTPESSICLSVGESLLINFNRSLDLAHSVNDGVSGAMPQGAKLDLASGFFAWQPRAVISQPIGLRFVVGAKAVTFSIEHRL